MRAFQKLICWLLPLELVAFVINNYSRNFLFDLEKREALAKLLHLVPSEVSNYIEWLGLGISIIIPAIIGIWLGSQCKEGRGNKWLWLGFGFVAGFWALALWHLVQMTETVRLVKPVPANPSPSVEADIS